MAAGCRLSSALTDRLAAAAGGNGAASAADYRCCAMGAGSCGWSAPIERVRRRCAASSNIEARRSGLWPMRSFHGRLTGLGSIY